VRAWTKHCTPRPLQIIQVAVEHRLMHAETFAYLLHAVPVTRKRGVVTHNAGTGVVQPNPLLRIPAGQATLGQSAGAFGWDNEFAQHRVDVPPFWVTKHKITNGEYLRFVRDGAPLPHFWTDEGRRFCYRGMFGAIPLPLDWPVYVTFNEATAYARWAGKRLITEPEFDRAAYGSHSGREHHIPGAPLRQIRNAATSIFTAGIRFPCMLRPPATARSAFPNSSEMDGSGPPHPSARLTVSNRFRSTRVTRLHSSTASTSSSKADRPGRLRTCFGARSGTGSARSILTSMQRFASPKLPDTAFALAVREGLCRTGQKRLPPEFFYDEIGSALFDVITLLAGVRIDAR
jgi:hypothetical protein